MIRNDDPILSGSENMEGPTSCSKALSCEDTWEIPIDSGFKSALIRNMEGKYESFQFHTKENRKTTIIAGRANGIITR